MVKRRWWVPRSIAARLMLGAALLVAVSLVMSGMGITLALQRFVRSQVDQRLDLQIAAVVAALEPGADGKLTLRGGVDAPPFDRPRGGWSWQAVVPGATFTSGSLGGNALALEPGREERRPRDPDRPRPGPDGFMGGMPVVSRSLSLEVAGQPVTVTATAPLRALTDPLRDALTPVAVTLIALGVLLAAGSVVQLRLGLRPLVAVRRAVEDVRHGRSARLPTDQPAELAPLVGELNALIEENAEGLKRARSHVANLGHALKTPLTSLSLSLGDGPDEAERRRLLAEMEERIRHHLGRARAAAVGQPARMATPVRARLDDLAEVLGKIHAARGLVLAVDVAPAIAAACEPQDLDEMLGNLLDNAFKWARTRIQVSAKPAGRMVEIAFEDDGAGLAEDRVPEALMPGRRLDETVPGHGFGLSICRELAELYGGSLALARSPLGGLGVTVTLPLA